MLSSCRMLAVWRITVAGLLALGVPVGGATWLVSEAKASATAARPIEGSFAYVGGTRQLEELDTAIEEVVEDMNFVIRPIARKRLRRGNVPSDTLTIEVRGSTIHVMRPGLSVVAAPVDGSFISWTGKDGDEFRVRHRFQHGGRTLVQEFYGDGGSHAVNTYRLSEDGTGVVLHTTIDANALPRTLRYRFSYQRTP